MFSARVHPGSRRGVLCALPTRAGERPPGQGFEYDYSGVIMGEDLVWRNGRWEPSAAASHDPSVRKADNFGLLTRNTYKVLLTRGLQGCIIHSVDQQTRTMLASLGVPVLRAPRHD